MRRRLVRLSLASAALSVALAASLATLPSAAPAAGAAGRRPAVPASDVQAALREAASLAQASCQKRIHHDTFVFERCVSDLLAGEKKPSLRRLGIEYFGFAGAMNSARMGMLGAEQTAWEFLQRYRLTQKRLGLDDDTVCTSVPGDCTTRIAQAKAMQSAGRPPVVAEPFDGDHPR